ncbi:TetR/AcrR family transcriptional regulator [Kitasatospora mediocidica]|uniref:TetR/AcrR family transcriptional regulator n=1 Tax=Kitasatospora mediocidica TaxID=58352 RepID=UPI000B24E4A9|nr:TetR/AcrR family transcriptional regulator [Kitasatospora mediocidica]
MMEQEHLLLGEPTGPQIGANTVPEQRSPLSVPYRAGPEHEGPAGTTEERRTGGSRLRVDARRNLESVLRAAREVFGELGYDAPMEEVARRAGVGVGTVYRRFPSKEVLVQRIAAEEVAWLTARAKEALYGLAGPWEALAAYLATAVATGAGRLLPPEAFRYAEELARVPEQRPSWDDAAVGPEPGAAPTAASAAAPGAFAGTGVAVEPAEPPASATEADADPRQLLRLLAALVARAAAAGELRAGVTVSEIVLVLTAAVPPSIGRGAGVDSAEPAERLLRILLDGLRAS